MSRATDRKRAGPCIGIGGMRLKLRFRYTAAVNRKRPCEKIPDAQVPDCARANAPGPHAGNRFTHRPLSELPDFSVPLHAIFEEQPRTRGVHLSSGNKEVPMRKLAIGLLAVAGIAMSVPASAQGVYVGAGPVGVGVGVGPGYGYRDGYYRDGYYGHGYRSYAYDDGYRRHCRTVRQEFNGRVRTVRRCW